MKRTTCEASMMAWMRDGYCLSSNTLAKLTSYTPQHITRTLKKLHKQGKVSYAVIPHQGRSKIARMWCGVGHEDYHSEYSFVRPQYVQTEMQL